MVCEIFSQELDECAADGGEDESPQNGIRIRQQTERYPREGCVAHGVADHAGAAQYHKDADTRAK